jgi:hypothetical protein
MILEMVKDLLCFQKSNFSIRLVSFPTPMEEQKKHLACKYLGCIYVEKPGGMHILRPAIEKVSMTVPEDKWISVIVNISPTSIVVSSDDVC